jgi:AraC-like DNA-binding protein
MIMNSRGSELRVSTEDLVDWSMETNARGEREYGTISRGSMTIHGDLLSGKFGAYVLRPGLDMFVLDLQVQQDTEILSGVDEPRAGLTMILAGSCTRKAIDHRGREIEGSARTHDNVAAAYYPKTWSLRLKGGESHKMLKLRLVKEHVPELIAGCETALAEPIRRILLPSEQPIAGTRRAISPTLQVLAHQVLHCPFQGATRRLFMEGKALEILACQLEEFSNEQRPQKTVSDPDELERLFLARRIVEKEFADPPTLFQLGRRVGLNDFKLKRGFKMLFGTTVFSHIRRFRMERARSLLECSNLSVTEVALETGYSHFGYFSAAFKKSFGILPGQYRKGRTIPSKRGDKDSGP